MAINETQFDEPVEFWELAGGNPNRQLEGETAGQFLARINDPTKWIYGHPLRDKMFLQDPDNLPRYASLARKAFMHYADENYNPHTIEMRAEIQIRVLIQWIIEYKVQGKAKGYDWEIIDNLLMSSVYEVLNLELPKDYKHIDREVLPKFRSIYHGLDFATKQ